MNDIGKAVITLGIVLIIVGIMMMLAGRIPWVGKLPGDIMIKKENLSVYFPITSCILLSIIISAIMCLIGKK